MANDMSRCNNQACHLRTGCQRGWLNDYPLPTADPYAPFPVTHFEPNGDSCEGFLEKTKGRPL